MTSLTSHLGISWNGGSPKSSILIGFSIINHPAIGVYPFLKTPISSQPLGHLLAVGRQKRAWPWRQGHGAVFWVCWNLGKSPCFPKSTAGKLDIWIYLGNFKVWDTEFWGCFGRKKQWMAGVSLLLNAAVALRIPRKFTSPAANEQSTWNVFCNATTFEFQIASA